MPDSDSDQEQVIELPKHRIIQQDMTQTMFQEILLISDGTCDKFQYDKDIAVSICEQIRLKDYEGGEGEWQCIIGKHFAASLQFDNKFLVFFTLVNRNKSFLIFKSG